MVPEHPLVPLAGPTVEKCDQRAMLRDRKSLDLQEEAGWHLLIEQAHRRLVQPARRDGQPQFGAGDGLRLTR